MDILSIKAVLLSLILCGGSLTIANTAIEPYQVVAVYQDSEDTKCFKIKDSKQQVCYKVEVESQAPTETQSEPTPVAKNYDNGDVEKLIREVFGSDANRALEIAYCESGLNPSAVGDTNTPYPSYGVFQIRGLPGRPSAQDLLNAEFNVNYAHQMFEQQGWRPWTCSRK